jgi:hypothetical protein
MRMATQEILLQTFTHTLPVNEEVIRSVVLQQVRAGRYGG